MSAHAENLGRAARLLKRVADMPGPSDFEGVPIKEIAGDVLMAQNRAYLERAVERFECHIDESAGLADVVPLHGYSRKVICD